MFKGLVECCRPERRAFDVHDCCVDDAVSQRAQLSDAVRQRDAKLVVSLIAKKADPNELDAAGKSILFEAVEDGNVRISSILLLAGCNPSHRCQSGATAADLASDEDVACVLQAFMGSDRDAMRLRMDPRLVTRIGKELRNRLMAQLDREQVRVPLAKTKHLRIPQNRNSENKQNKDDRHRPEQADNYDWGRALWREMLEHAVLRVSFGTELWAATEGQDESCRMIAPEAANFRLAQGVTPRFVDKQGDMWVRVVPLNGRQIGVPLRARVGDPSSYAGSRDVEPEEPPPLPPPSLPPPPRAGLQSRRPQPSPKEVVTVVQNEWWAQWAHLQLVPTSVQSMAHLEAEVDLHLHSSARETDEYRQAWAHRMGEWHGKIPFYAIQRDSQIDPESYPMDATLADFLYRVFKSRCLNENLLERRGRRVSSMDMSSDGSSVSLQKSSVWNELPAVRAVNPYAVQGRVSVCCPTHAGRHHLHEHLYHCFQAQTWPDKELIVLDSGGFPSPFFTSPPFDPRVLYLHIGVYPFTLGDKRNQLISLASGEIIAWFDDDNLYAPQYLVMMVSQLRASRAQLMQLAATFNWNVRRGEICQHFEARDRAENFVHLRGPLRAMAFNPTEFGEEIGFCSVCVCHSIDDDFGIFIHIEHDSNTSKTYDDTGTPVNLKDIPNPAVKEMFSKHQRFFSR